MELRQTGTSPRIVTSKRNVVYRQSSWNVYQFQVWSGEQIARVIALKMAESLLLWVGGPEERRLGEVALSMPSAKPSGKALSTTLLEDGAPAAALALRVAAGLHQPVFVCCALALDRLNSPLLERALAAEIRLCPEKFHT